MFCILSYFQCLISSVCTLSLYLSVILPVVYTLYLILCTCIPCSPSVKFPFLLTCSKTSSYSEIAWWKNNSNLSLVMIRTSLNKLYHSKLAKHYNRMLIILCMCVSCITAEKTKNYFRITTVHGHSNAMMEVYLPIVCIPDVCTLTLSMVLSVPVQYTVL